MLKLNVGKDRQVIKLPVSHPGPPGEDAFEIIKLCTEILIRLLACGYDAIMHAYMHACNAMSWYGWEGLGLVWGWIVNGSRVSL